MIELDGLVGIVALFLWIYCILDVIASEPMLVRNLHKMVWLLIVIFLPEVGSVAWLVLGRPKGAGLTPGSTDRQARAPRGPMPPAPIGPDDDPRFLRNADERRLREWEDELRRREERLRREEGDTD